MTVFSSFEARSLSSKYSKIFYSLQISDKTRTQLVFINHEGEQRVRSKIGSEKDKGDRYTPLIKPKKNSYAEKKWKRKRYDMR